MSSFNPPPLADVIPGHPFYSTMKPVQIGDRYKVKRDWFTKSHGFRAGNPRDDSDYKAWPGEIGTIIERRWIAWDDSECSDICLEFERGRVRVVNDDGTFGDDSQHLTKVRD